MKTIESSLRGTERALGEIFSNDDLVIELDTYYHVNEKTKNQQYLEDHREELVEAGFSEEQIETLLQWGLTPERVRTIAGENLMFINGFTAGDWMKLRELELLD